MSVFVISDLHLPGGEKKPMDIFGAQWTGHFERIQADWRACVREDDLVLLAGDISWAMRLEAAQEDLDAIGALPGRKVILRGNHDYWWSSISRVRAALPEGMYALQNDALAFGDVIVCGSRGWVCPGSPAYDEEDTRIWTREVNRLSLSLENAARLYEDAIARGETPRLIVMLHYPPFVEQQDNEMTELLGRYPVRDVVYGHLHGPGISGAFNGEFEGIRYHLTSCDALGFELYGL